MNVFCPIARKHPMHLFIIIRRTLALTPSTALEEARAMESNYIAKLFLNHNHCKPNQIDRKQTDMFPWAIHQLVHSQTQWPEKPSTPLSQDNTLHAQLPQQPRLPVITMVTKDRFGLILCIQRWNIKRKVIIWLCYKMDCGLCTI